MFTLLHSPRFARRLDTPPRPRETCTCRVDCADECDGACGCRACFEAARADAGPRGDAAELVVRF